MESMPIIIKAKIHKLNFTVLYTNKIVKYTGT